MPPKVHKPMHRVRATQRSVEAKNFSTVRMPRSSEIAVNTHNTIHQAESSAVGPHTTHDDAGQHRPPSTAAGSGGFDPIANDPLFSVVEQSAYWPPPPLEQLLAKFAESRPDIAAKMQRKQNADDAADAWEGGDSDENDDASQSNGSSGADDDNEASAGGAPKNTAATVAALSADMMDLYDRRADNAAARKELKKQVRVAGELRHPRGKAPVNTKVAFDEGDDSD